MKNRVAVVLLTAALFFPVYFSGCGADNNGGQARFVFLFIGDGMSTTHITAAEIYAHVNGGGEGVGLSPLSFTQFPVTGLTTTHDYENFITDSASAGTAIASGRKTLGGSINTDPRDPSIKFTPITRYAKEAGMKVGIVTSVTLTHATPAAFFAAHPARWESQALAQQLIDSGFDFFAGGNIVSNPVISETFLDAARQNGFTVARTRAEFDALAPGAGRVIAIPPPEGLQDGGSMFYEIDRNPNNPEHFSLADYTRKGIELLYNSGGFFMMIEGGKIDWAGHANDAVAIIHDIFAMDEAIQVALEFYRRHPNETLIIVTSDHDTGGMSLGVSGGSITNRGVQNFRLLRGQTMSFVAFDNIINDFRQRANPASQLSELYDDINAAFGINLAVGAYGVDFAGDALAPFQRAAIDLAFRVTFRNELGLGPEIVPLDAEILYQYGNENAALRTVLLREANRRAGIGWTTFHHTAVPTPVFAKGAGQELFTGFYDNTDLFFRMASAMGLNVGSRE